MEPSVSLNKSPFLPPEVILRDPTRERDIGCGITRQRSGTGILPVSAGILPATSVFTGKMPVVTGWKPAPSFYTLQPPHRRI